MIIIHGFYDSTWLDSTPIAKQKSIDSIFKIITYKINTNVLKQVH